MCRMEVSVVRVGGLFITPRRCSLDGLKRLSRARKWVAIGCVEIARSASAEGLVWVKHWVFRVRRRNRRVEGSEEFGRREIRATLGQHVRRGMTGAARRDRVRKRQKLI
jgi:hypothetical protein